MPFLVIGLLSLVISVFVGHAICKDCGDISEGMAGGFLTLVLSFLVLMLISLAVGLLIPTEERILFEERFPIVENERVRIIEMKGVKYVAFYISDKDGFVMKKYDDWMKREDGEKGYIVNRIRTEKNLFPYVLCIKEGTYRECYITE